MAAEPSHRTDRLTTDPATEPTARTATVEAAITLRVPRGAMGDLPTGVREVLAAVAGVETVEVGEIRTVRPTSFDIHVDVTARLGTTLEPTDPDVVRERLLDGFGIEAVEVVVVDLDVG